MLTELHSFNHNHFKDLTKTLTKTLALSLSSFSVMVRFFPHEISQTNFFSTKSGYVHWNSFNNDYQAQSIHFFRGMYYLICNSIDVNNRIAHRELD